MKKKQEAAMNREELIEKMKATGFEADQYWIQAGAAMLLHGLREHTHDIDIGCTPALMERIRAMGCPYEVLEDGHRKYAVTEDIEASENWAPGTVTLIEGLPVVSLEDVLRLKEHLGRDKDLRDIRRIREHLQNKTQSE